LSKSWTTRPLGAAAIHTLRKATATVWRDKWAATCPNLVMSRYLAVMAAGVSEAYDRWLLSGARPDEWTTWEAANTDAVRALAVHLEASLAPPKPTDRFGLDHY
jgi:hypothetical protein